MKSRIIQKRNTLDELRLEQLSSGGKTTATVRLAASSLLAVSAVLASMIFTTVTHRPRLAVGGEHYAAPTEDPVNSIVRTQLFANADSLLMAFQTADVTDRNGVSEGRLQTNSMWHVLVVDKLGTKLYSRLPTNADGSSDLVDRSDPNKSIATSRVNEILATLGAPVGGKRTIDSNLEITDGNDDRRYHLIHSGMIGFDKYAPHEVTVEALQMTVRLECPRVGVFTSIQVAFLNGGKKREIEVFRVWPSPTD